MKNILLLGVLMLVTFTQAQISILSQKKIGAGGDDMMSVFPAKDNSGYYVIGSSNSLAFNDKTSPNIGGYDLWIVKTDLNYNILWDKTIGGSGDEYLSGCIVSDTAIYCLISTSSSNSYDVFETNYGLTDMWMIKLDLNGNILKQKLYGGSNNDYPASLIEWNNHFLITSNSTSPISGNKNQSQIGGYDFWFIEIDKNDFSILSEKVIGSSTDDMCTHIIKTSTNELYLLSKSQYGVSNDKTDIGFGGYDAWLLKLDSSLGVVNNKCFGGLGQEDFSGSIFAENDSVLYLSIISNSTNDGNKSTVSYGDYDSWLVKIDSSFNIIWDKSFGGSSVDAGISFFKYNDNLLLTGMSYSMENTGNKTAINYGQSDSWLIVLDTAGNDLFQYSFGGSSNDNGGIAFAKNDTLFFVGTTTSPVSGNQTTGCYGTARDAWLLNFKLSGLGLEKESEQSNNIDVYPNPFSKQVTFSLKSAKYETSKIELFSADGRKIDEIEINQATNQAVWNPKCENGIYYYSCGNINGKIMYVK